MVPDVDCLQLLKSQHDDAKKLFKQLESAKGTKAAELWKELEAALQVHEQLEEKHLYPELKKNKAAHDLVLEAYEEHHVMDVLIAEISALKPTDEAFHPKLSVLQENTEHHIEEEEGDLFPKVRKIWDTTKRQDVGQQMEQSKQKLAKSAA
jgi:hypothetical protein